MAAGQYHINPETGAVGPCKARYQCRFEGESHYETLAEANAAYEAIVNNFRANAKPSKRGKSKESFSDSRNGFIRAAFDKVLGTNKNLSESWRGAVIQFHGCCYLCGKRIYDNNGYPIPGSEIQADHIVPPKNGGTISAGNMAPAHRYCNDDKGDTPVEIYLLEKGRPDLLKLVKGFQKEFGYTPPPQPIVDLLQEEVNRIWQEAEEKVVGLRDKYQAMVEAAERGEEYQV